MKMYYKSVVIMIGFAFSSIAQPIIQNGNLLPNIGYSNSVSLGIASSGTGNPGANQIWNFSTVSLSSVGSYNVVSPSVTPYFSSYSTANFAFTIPTSSAYHYSINSPNKLEVLTENTTSGPGSGKDYSPNPQTQLVYPFHFGDVVIDAFQKVGFPNDTITLSYDGYGTLIMPYSTYTNVIRTKGVFKSNGFYYYMWWSLNPLKPLLRYESTSNQLIAWVDTQTGLNEEINRNMLNITHTPNPINDILNIQIDNLPNDKNLSIQIMNLTGESILKCKITESKMTINLGDISSGIYFYQVFDDNNGIKYTGRFIK